METKEITTEEGELVEIYEGEPDFSAPLGITGGLQDEPEPQNRIVGFLANTTRRTAAVFTWYNSHRTTYQLGYNPDGMCLKICREARNIPAVHPSAKAAMDATPKGHRITKIEDVKRGMIAYYAHPTDSNPFDHIVTVAGRIKGADPKRLDHLLMKTNSVKSGQIVTVRGDYFQKYWGDPFKFAAISLNGYEFPDFIKPVEVKPKPEPKPLAGKGASIMSAIKALQTAAQYHRREKNRELANELEDHVAALRATYKKYGGK